MQNPITVIRNNPYLFFYLAFGGLVLGVYGVLQPGWGFMDDIHCRGLARGFWSGQISLQDICTTDMRVGRFRPLYYLWIVMAYTQPPLLLYMFIFMAGMGVLLVWGRMIAIFFPGIARKDFVRYICPLFFFAFPPFWNIFMYISVQEKFVFLFGTGSLYFLLRAYQTGAWVFLAVAVGLAYCGVFGKETGLALIGAYGVYALADLVYFGSRRRLSGVLLACSLIFGVGYVIFIKSVIGQYTGGYKANLAPGTMINLLYQAPLIVKVMLGLAATAFAGCLLNKKVHSLFLICPAFVIIFLCLLLPWGFPNYLLAPLGPWVMMCFYFWIFPVFGHRHAGPAVRLGIAAIIVIVLFLDIVPRISKMADKRKVAAALADFPRVDARYFYPLPFVETGDALEFFAGVDITCTGLISGKGLAKTANYLVVNDEAAPVMLEDVAVGDIVYRNGTWAVHALRPSPGARGQFYARIAGGPLKFMKDRISQL